MDAIEYVWGELNKRIQKDRETFSQFEARSERSELTGAFDTSTLSDAPLAADGAANGDIFYITDGRKTGETAGNGTGVPAYYDSVTDSWLVFRDDSAVTT